MAKDKKPLYRHKIHHPFAVYDYEPPLAPNEKKTGILSDLIMEGGGDFIKFLRYVELFAHYIDRVKTEVKGAHSLEKMVEVMELGVTRFGHELVRQWFKERSDFFKEKISQVLFRVYRLQIVGRNENGE